MYNDPYLGITKPVPLYDSIEIIVDRNSYISIQLFEKKRIKYYEVVFYNNGNEIFLGKFYEDNYILNVSYKDGKILVHNDQFNHDLGKIQIAKVLVLYDIDDDVFYYCTEEEVLKLFDENIDSSSLKNKNNKILRTDIRKKIKHSLFQDNVSNANDKKSSDPEIINISNLLSKEQNNSKFLECFDKEKTKVIKIPK